MELGPDLHPSQSVIDAVKSALKMKTHINTRVIKDCRIAKSMADFYLNVNYDVTLNNTEICLWCSKEGIMHIIAFLNEGDEVLIPNWISTLTSVTNLVGSSTLLWFKRGWIGSPTLKLLEKLDLTIKKIMDWLSSYANRCKGKLIWKVSGFQKNMRYCWSMTIRIVLF
jgi:hypothetical protein